MARKLSLAGRDALLTPAASRGLSTALLLTWQGTAPACSGGAVAAGRVQAGSSLSSCLLHKGTILGVPLSPCQGISSPAACLPPVCQKETSLGMGVGTGTALGAQQRAREAIAFLKEQQWGKAGPTGVGSSALGLEGAVNTHFRHHSSSDACSRCWGRRRLGTGREVWRHVLVPGCLLQAAQHQAVERAERFAC